MKTYYQWQGREPNLGVVNAKPRWIDDRQFTSHEEAMKYFWDVLQHCVDCSGHRLLQYTPKMPNGFNFTIIPIFYTMNSKFITGAYYARPNDDDNE